MIREGNTVLAPGEAAFDVCRATDLEAFDALPAVIREAINAYPIPIAATPILSFWIDADGATGLDCVERLASILSALSETP